MGCGYTEARRSCVDCNESASMSTMDSSSLIETVMEEREDPQTSTAVFCSAIPYNQTVCEPLVSKGLSLLWYLSNAFSTSVLEASLILYLLDIFFSLKGRVAVITRKCCCTTELLPGLMRSEATKQCIQPKARTLKSSSTRVSYSIGL